MRSHGPAGNQGRIPHPCGSHACSAQDPSQPDFYDPLQVITPEGVVVGKLSDGAYFGEIAILVDVRRTSSVRTSCRCHFYKLSKEDFDAVLAGFPELKVVPPQCTVSFLCMAYRS